MSVGKGHRHALLSSIFVNFLHLAQKFSWLLFLHLCVLLLCRIPSLLFKLHFSCPCSCILKCNCKRINPDHNILDKNKILKSTTLFKFSHLEMVEFLHKNSIRMRCNTFAQQWTSMHPRRAMIQWAGVDVLDDLRKYGDFELRRLCKVEESTNSLNEIEMERYNSNASDACVLTQSKALHD